MKHNLVIKLIFKIILLLLEVEEVIKCLRRRWQVTYDLQLVVRSERLYLQIMWAYLEQRSFPLDEDQFIAHLFEIIEVVNRIGLSDEVRNWLETTSKKPRLGRAVSLHLDADQTLLQEFVL